MVSVIIPVYNEQMSIGECLASLAKQSYKPFEIIVVDDGSTDKTSEVLSKSKIQNPKSKIFKQTHLGPAQARNLGAKHAKGKILVFVDADMTFDKDFIKKLVEPIEKGKIKGTFTKEEYVSNWENPWARCFNYNEGIFDKRRVPISDPDTSVVFRAILRSEFEIVGGFDPIGFTDDWTLSRKLGLRANAVPRAICYHKNPESLREVYRQARWIGKNEFISGSFIRKFYNIFRYNLLVRVIKGIYLLFKTGESYCIAFQLIYGFGITRGIIGSLFGEHKNK